MLGATVVSAACITAGHARTAEHLAQVLASHWTIAALGGLAEGGRRYQDLWEALDVIAHKVFTRHCGVESAEMLSEWAAADATVERVRILTSPASSLASYSPLPERNDRSGLDKCSSW